MSEISRIVSSEDEELIVVDVDDRPTGFMSKAECHDGEGVLHRAFSAFLFDDRGALLLQQRAKSKRLWPGFWSNSCCSHPRRNESMQVATRRRLNDELNIEAKLQYVYKFRYRATFGDAGSEHELCHVYIGRVSGVVRPNAEEIAAIRFVAPDELTIALAENPGDYTPWLRLEWKALTTQYADLLAAYQPT